MKNTNEMNEFVNRNSLVEGQSKSSRRTTLTSRLSTLTSRLSTFTSRLSTLVLFVFCLFFSGTAWGQKSLPYSYGFENDDLTGEGWNAYGAEQYYTGIFDADDNFNETAHGGSNIFSFEYDERNAYLVSPALTGTANGLNLVFYYRAYSTEYGDESFKVGYTTGNSTDPTTYTYGNEIFTSGTSWHEYSNTFPAGTKRIAIKYIYNDAFYLFLDDFSFTSSSGGGGVVTYCTPSFSNPSDDYISSFATTGGTSNINNTTGASTNGYGDYYSIYSASIAAGQTLSCTVTSSTTQWDYGHAIWVDWNKDGDFSDSGERVAYTTSAATGNWTGNVVVHAATPAGDYRMRVMHYYDTDSPNNPCVSDTYGEVEDYKLTVTATSSCPNTIASLSDWNTFCEKVNDGSCDYDGETVTLTANISNVATMAGTSSHPFRGTFEGGGHKISVSISSSEQGAAPFRYIDGATIQNLEVDGTVTSTAHHASGLVGFCADGSSNTIQNCLVSTNVTNNNAYNGDSGNNYMGGIIGHNMTATTSIIGCVYNGTLTSQGFKGGIIGFAGSNSTINLTNTYFGGSYSANGYGYPNFSPIGVKSSGRRENLTFSNFYYSTDAGNFTVSGYNIMNGTNNVTGTPKHAYTVTGASPVTVAMSGSPTTYSKSGISAYTNGIKYNSVIYCGQSDVLSLTLSGGSWYYANYGTLTGSSNPYTLTLPADLASNVVINCCIEPTSLTVDDITASSATISWTSSGGTVQFSTDGTNWETMNTNSKTLTGLTAATTYTVYVRTNCGGGNYSGSVSESFTTELCDPEDMCEITFELTDSYGDGWNGNKIVVTDAVTGDVLGEFTNVSASADVAEIYTLAVCDGRDIVFSWVSGSYTYETSYVVKDANGGEIFSGADVMSGSVNYTMSCPTCKKPIVLTAGTPNTTSVQLSWTAVGSETDWQICVNGDEENLVNADSNPFNLTDLMQGTTYTVKVRAYCGVSEQSNWSNSVTFITDETCHRPTSLTASDITPVSAQISWSATASGYNLRYGKAYTFDDGTMQGWTTIDADGDGYDWVLGSVTDGIYYNGLNLAGPDYCHNSSLDMLVSGSYTNYAGTALNPNNYLVSPQITFGAGASISFWAKGQDPTYAAEHFGVAVSTTGTNASDFMLVPGSEEYIATSDWVEYTVDLSGYSGQGYIAIRHYNISDMFLLLVDDISIMSGNTAIDVVSNASSPYSLTGLEPNTTYWVQVQSDCGSDGLSGWASTTFTTASPVYSADINDVDYGDSYWCVGDTRTVTVTLENTGNVTWYADEDATSAECNSLLHKVVLTSRWYYQSSFNDGIVVDIDSDVAPGETTTVEMEITPTEAGGTNLLFNLRKMDCLWFSGDNVTSISATPTINVVDQPSISATPNPSTTCVSGQQVVITASDAVVPSSFSWTETGTEGTANNTTYTVTPADFSNTYTVTNPETGCSNSITINVVSADNILSPDAAIECGATVTLSASGIDDATYNWYSDAECNSSVTFPTSALVGTSANYYVKATKEFVSDLYADVRTFGYEGEVKEVSIPEGTEYVKLEVWGAQGGYRTDESKGGKGGYAVGVLTDLSEISNLYVCVGSSGNTGGTSGGYNGGGSRETFNGGGGATHIATATGVLSGLSGNTGAVLIVAGGGGSDGGSSKSGGAGGGTNGIDPTEGWGDAGAGGTQNAGGTGGNGNSGSFGQGGAGAYASDGYAGAGGGGWYGGGGSYPDTSSDDDKGGAGGSGYVKSTLSSAELIAGNATMPNPAGGTMTGRSGDGYARITFYRRDYKTCTSNAKQVSVAITPANVTLTQLEPQSMCAGTVLELSAHPEASTTNSTEPVYEYSWIPATGLSISSGVINISRSGSFTYNVVATLNDNAACTAIDSKTVEVAYKTPSASEITAMGLENGNLLWTGLSTNWNASNNWMLYSGGTYTLASAPTSLSNVVVGSYSDCVSTPTLNVNADASVNSLKIASGITVSGANTLSMDGNLVNNGTFDAPVRFNGNTTLSGSGTTTFRDITIAGTFNASSATLTVSGGWTNNGTFTANGPVVFAGASAQNIAGNNATTFNNVTFSNANGISISKEPTINGTATFSSGIVTGNVTFGTTGSSANASMTSYVDGTVTKNGNGSPFTFPTGSDGVLGTITATIGSGSWVSAKYNHNSSDNGDGTHGFTTEVIPRWWNAADMCDNPDQRFDHVSNFEYWDVSSPVELSNVTLVSEAASGAEHFNSASAYVNNDIQLAAYTNGCWKNFEGTAVISGADHNVITITGATIPKDPHRAAADFLITLGSKSKNTVLPIELTSFTATCDGRSALVEWTTATERNNDYFSLERSDDAINFTEIARVAGAGNSIEPIDYAYNDYGIHGGDNYYRLVQVDYDGTRTVSDIVVANCIEEQASDPDVLAYPNPFNGELTLVLDNFSNRPATIEVYDMLGKLIYTEKASAPQNSYETILNLSNLPSGAYTVRVSTTDFVINKNVVKQ